MTSVTYRAYVYLEDIYLKAEDESKEETDAHDLMYLIWNLLTTEEKHLLTSRGWNHHEIIKQEECS